MKLLVLNATISPQNATNKNLVWSSSNNKGTKVDNGSKVTALEKGEATIIVKNI